MSVAPHDLLAAAQALHKSPSTEAERRALVSRAYYAAYHAAYKYHSALPSLGSVGNANGKHEQLIAQLQNPSIKSSDPKNLESRRVGIILGSLFAARVKADYYLEQTVSEDDAEVALFQVEDIFKICFPSAKLADPT